MSCDFQNRARVFGRAVPGICVRQPPHHSEISNAAWTRGCLLNRPVRQIMRLSTRRGDILAGIGHHSRLAKFQHIGIIECAHMLYVRTRQSPWYVDSRDSSITLLLLHELLALLFIASCHIKQEKIMTNNHDDVQSVAKATTSTPPNLKTLRECSATLFSTSSSRMWLSCSSSRCRLPH